MLPDLVAEGALHCFGPLLHLPGHAVRLSAAEETLWDELRGVLSGLRSGGVPVPDADGLAALCRTRLLALAQPSLRPVFNLTGTVLHTTLGRAPLPPEALRQIVATAGACTLEYDLDTAGRGHRDVHLEALLCRLTGAEAATVVNNNAAAVLLLYLNPDTLAERLPTLRLLARKQPDIAAAAHRLQPPLPRALGSSARVAVEPCASQIGSGALPLRTLPSACLAVTPAAPGRGEGRWLERTAAFRALPMPVIGHIGDGALRFDLRTPEDEAAFLAQFPAIGLPADGGCRPRRDYLGEMEAVA